MEILRPALRVEERGGCRNGTRPPPWLNEVVEGPSPGGSFSMTSFVRH